MLRTTMQPTFLSWEKKYLREIPVPVKENISNVEQISELTSYALRNE